MTELQSAAFPLGYTADISAERVELPFSESGSDVLPLDEAEVSGDHPEIIQRRVSRQFKDIRKYHQIVDGRHGVASHPFEYGLRCIETAFILNI